MRKFTVSGAFCVVMAACGQGCLPAPVPASKAGGGLSTGPTLPAAYWKADAALPIVPNPPAVRRIAVTEFAVEFVTVRTRGPFASQPIIETPPLSPLSAVVAVVGLRRAVTPIAETQRQHLAQVLFKQFTDRLKSNGYEVVPQSDLQGKTGYALLTMGHRDGQPLASSPVRYLHIVSTDVGVINQTSTVPAPGTRLADFQQSEDFRQRSKHRLMQEVNADTLLRVHVRVGCYKDRAAVEQGSQVWMTRRGGRELELASQRSLLSDQPVGSPSHFELVVGNVEPFKQQDFDTQICKLMDIYLQPALVATLGIAPKPTVQPVVMNRLPTLLQ